MAGDSRFKQVNVRFSSRSAQDIALARMLEEKQAEGINISSTAKWLLYEWCMAVQRHGTIAPPLEFIHGSSPIPVPEEEETEDPDDVLARRMCEIADNYDDDY